MWLFTNFGFYSVVRKKEDGDQYLTIRGRTRSDLDRLRKRYLPKASSPVENAGTDYRWRVRCTKDDLAAAMPKIVRHIDYSNFKSEVARSLSADRAKRYGKVWDALYGLDEDKPEPEEPQGWDGLPWPEKASPGKARAFGGVVIDAERRVLIREVAKHHDGYVWSFAKGRPDKGEYPREAALREVKEELGVDARIVKPLSGSYHGSTTENFYFLMEVDPKAVDMKFASAETWRIRWVTPNEARELIAKTTNASGRERDLKVLDVALAAFDHLAA